MPTSDLSNIVIFKALSLLPFPPTTTPFPVIVLFPPEHSRRWYAVDNPASPPPTMATFDITAIGGSTSSFPAAPFVIFVFVLLLILDDDKESPAPSSPIVEADENGMDEYAIIANRRGRMRRRRRGLDEQANGVDDDNEGGGGWTRLQRATTCLLRPRRGSIISPPNVIIIIAAAPRSRSIVIDEVRIG